MIAETAVVEVDALGAEALGQEAQPLLQEAGGRDVEHLAAAAAQKMGVGRRHAVETGVVAVDGEHRGCTLADEKAERVVDRRFREGGYLPHQCVVDFVGRGVRAVRAEIFHHGQPLHGWLDVVGDKGVVGGVFAHLLLI